MPARWTTSASGRAVRASEPGSGPASSVAAAALVLFLFSVVVIVGGAWLLPRTDGGTPSDDGITGRAAASPSPASSAGAPVATAAPRRTDPPPRPPVEASPSPTSQPRLADLDRPVPLVIAGERVGRVTVEALRPAIIEDVELPIDRRLVVATVRLAALTRLAYDESHWLVEGDDGQRWPALSPAPLDGVGSGMLEPQETLTASIAFAVPRGMTMRSVVLTDGAGGDLVVFARARPSG